MKLKIACLCITVALFLFCSPSAFATKVEIDNFSFEETDGILQPLYWEGPWTHGAIPDWTYNGPSGIFGAWQVTSGYNDPVPNGNWIGYLIDGSLEQDLEWTVVKGATFHFSIDIGHRARYDLPDYEVLLFAGDHVLTSGSVNVEEGEFETLSLGYNVNDGSEDIIGKTLGVRISYLGGVGQLNFDNLKLSNSLEIKSVPEPSTILLFGIGLAGVAGFLRRKIK